jgi:DNA-binding NarL/FixJ family response regulator
MRVVIAEDQALLREGVIALLREYDIEVVAHAEDGPGLLRIVNGHKPDLAIVDVRLPPTFTDEGVRAAIEARAQHPGLGILILSQYVEVGIATRLLAESPERLGYLLKDRVIASEDFVGTLRRVAEGGSALDPQIVSRLLASVRADGPLDSLTPREREVLELVAEGRSNQAIADELGIALRSAEKHVSTIFTKLGLPDTGGEHRRVLAVLRYLRGT